GTVTSAQIATSLISTIQGAGTTSPLAGQNVAIEGIVTRNFPGAAALNGFYVQEEDTDRDSSPLTSEAVFVFDQNGAFTGNVGDKVRLTGVVSEFASTGVTLTEITVSSAANLTIISTGNPLPAPTSVTFPVTNVSDLERYEGMLVTASASSGNLVVTEYFELGRFGNVVLSSGGLNNEPGTDERLDQFTQFHAPNTADFTAYQANNARRSIVLDDASGVQNPSQIIFGRGGDPLSASNTLRGGDAVTSITAILDHRFGDYRLQTATGSDVNFQPANPRPTTPPGVGAATLKVASFNVLNYFTDLDSNPASNSPMVSYNGNSFEPRGAETAEEFTRQRNKTIQAITISGADVMGLNEMENNGFGSASAIQNLVDGLNTATAPGTYTFINSGYISTDAITVAMIYKPAAVTPLGSAAAIPNAFGNGAFDVVGRKPLAQTFQQNSNGAVFTVVANHWKSKGSGSGAGNADSGDGQGASNGTRTRQAQDLVSWLATKPTGTNDPDYLIVGDLNAYAQENPLTTLYSAGYVNMVPNTSYSYVFDGQVGALDHALRSASLQAQVTGTEKWHINSDEPNVLDYNTNFKTAGQISSLYSADQFRTSDHDPVIVGLSLVSPVTALSISFTAVPTTLLTSGNTSLSATVTGGKAPYSYSFSGPGTLSATGNTATVSGLPAGVQTFTVVAADATSPNSQTISATVSVQVTQANRAPVASAIPDQIATTGQ
ncbi:MAG TPA: ExeM/NucH family extracellular endonuclease, partial [Fibrella sp.]